MKQLITIAKLNYLHFFSQITPKKNQNFSFIYFIFQSPSNQTENDSPSLSKNGTKKQENTWESKKWIGFQVKLSSLLLPLVVYLWWAPN